MTLFQMQIRCSQGWLYIFTYMLFTEVSHILTYILDKCKLWYSLNQYLISAADSSPFSFEILAKDIVSTLWSSWTRPLACWHTWHHLHKTTPEEKLFLFQGYMAFRITFHISFVKKFKSILWMYMCFPNCLIKDYKETLVLHLTLADGRQMV